MATYLSSASMLSSCRVVRYTWQSDLSHLVIGMNRSYIIWIILLYGLLPSILLFDAIVWDKPWGTFLPPLGGDSGTVSNVLFCILLDFFLVIVGFVYVEIKFVFVDICCAFIYYLSNFCNFYSTHALFCMLFMVQCYVHEFCFVKSLHQSAPLLRSSDVCC